MIQPAKIYFIYESPCISGISKLFEEKLSNFKPKYFYVLSIIKDQLKLRRIKVVKENFFGESQSKLINHG